MKNANFIFMTNFDDIYFISEYVKAFNEDFRLCYDHIKNCYVVFDTSDGSVVLTTNNYPDFSVIKRLYETRRENFFKLFDEIEKNNAALEENMEKSISLKSACQLCEVMDYASKNPSKTITQNQIRKIIGENND